MSLPVGYTSSVSTPSAMQSLPFLTRGSLELSFPHYEEAEISQGRSQLLKNQVFYKFILRWCSSFLHFFISPWFTSWEFPKPFPLVSNPVLPLVPTSHQTSSLLHFPKKSRPPEKCHFPSSLQLSLLAHLFFPLLLKEEVSLFLSQGKPSSHCAWGGVCAKSVSQRFLPISMWVFSHSPDV